MSFKPASVTARRACHCSILVDIQRALQQEIIGEAAGRRVSHRYHVAATTFEDVNVSVQLSALYQQVVRRLFVSSSNRAIAILLQQTHRHSWWVTALGSSCFGSTQL